MVTSPTTLAEGATKLSLAIEAFLPPNPITSLCRVTARTESKVTARGIIAMAMRAASRSGGVRSGVV